ncbi:MAG TPA: CpaF family protein, partial [Solirubrobacteraceae bacterium]|nr:CpaF family protein [Solirubrobacteraceae bacterium]
MELHERLSKNQELRDRLAPVPADRVPEPAPEPFSDVKNRIHLALIEDLGRQLFNTELDPATLAHRVREELRRRLGSEAGISREDRERLVEELADDILGHGPLERLLEDETVSEIMVNGPFDIWVERAGRLHKTPIRFSDESHLRRIISKIVAQVGRRIDEGSPMVDARLPDGSRVNAVIPPLTLTGSLLTIRKFANQKLDLRRLVENGALTAETSEFLTRCVGARLNILISGGTGAGKTTMLNALSGAIPDHERIVTIEDAAELQLSQRHVLRLESRPKNIEGEGEVTIRDLVRNSLRMRPDRIVVGEVRGGEALDMLQAMNTGHDGSLSTLHANSPRDALTRLETMVLMAGYDLPLRAVREQISSAIDLMLHVERMQDGARRVVAITEVQRMEADVITIQDLYAYKVEGVSRSHVVGALTPTGFRPSFADKFERRGIDVNAAEPEPPGPL